MIRGSLQRQLLLVVFIAAVPAFIAHFAFQIYIDMRTARDHTTADVQDVAIAAMPLLKSALIVGDLATAQEMLDEIMSHGQFHTLRVVDPAGQLVLADGKLAVIAKSKAAPAWFVEWLDIRFPQQRFPILVGGENYGVLVAEPSSLFLVADLWERFWAAGAIWLCTLVIFIALVGFTLRHSLKPLDDLADAAHQLGAGELECRVPVSAVPELAETAIAFNRMAENLLESRKKLEQRVQEATSELENLIVRIPVGVYKLRMMKDETLRFDYVSPRWCELLEVAADEAYRDPLVAFNCIHPGERETFFQLNETVRQTLAPFSWEGRLRDGLKVRWLHVESIPTVLDNGDILWEGIQYDITATKERETELDHIAHYDALTGIPNRMLLADRLRQALAQGQRTGTLVAVCYLDLDGFKPVNDQLGHEAGDAVLVEIARRLHDNVRGGDTVARIGGDEFVMLLVSIGCVDECEVTLRRVLEAIEAPIPIGEHGVTVTASMGVAFYPRDNLDPDLLLRDADRAMYQAKLGGRNKCHFFSAP